MSSVVLDNSASTGAPNSSTLTANGCRLGAGGLGSSGAVQGLPVIGLNSLIARATQVSAGTNPTSFNWDNAGSAGGGLTPNHLQLFGYFDPLVTVQTIQEFADIYPAPVGGTAPALTTTSCFRTNQSVPLNYVAPFIGTTTGTGAALVVACAGIPTSANIRFYLVGGSIAAFAAGVAAPSAISVQPNVSFTYTGTTGAIYGYEVLFA
jgi:hypothetical protein